MIVNEQELIKTYEDIAKLTPLLIEAKSRFDSLDKFKNMKLEVLISKDPSGSYAEAKRKASISKEWGEYLCKLSKAENEYTKYKIEMERLKICWDTLRSIISLNKNIIARTI